MSFIILWAVCVIADEVIGLQDIASSGNLEPDNCKPGPKGRVEWLLHIRNSDYGWNEHTHRANIAVAVNRYRGSAEEMRKMELQLEVEVTKALFRNTTTQVLYENDLALFIHALLATNRSPRDFHGTDLVADLLYRVDNTIRSHGPVHPFLVLALCNARAVKQYHLESIRNFAAHDHENTDLDGRKTELKALTLKAYACAASLDTELDKFRKEMERAMKCLTRRQNEFQDGSFGNVYTTSLAVQALTAVDKVERNWQPDLSWNKQAALNFLREQAFIDVNIVKTYYIEMALNAEDVTFIKDLYTKDLVAPAPLQRVGHYISYSVKNEGSRDFYLTLTMQVQPGKNFFDIMKEAEKLSDRFGFNYTMSAHDLPMIHMVSGTPNDAEENMFWRICRQSRVNHVEHTSKTENFRDSPARLIPERDEHIQLWYRNTDCQNNP